MRGSRPKYSRLARSIYFAGLILAGAGFVGIPPVIGLSWIAPAHAQTVAPLAPNDVSWLFPVPVHVQDLAALISIADVSAAGQPGSVWRDDVFQRFLDIAAGDQALVAGTSVRIGLPAEVTSIAVWKISAIRIDAGAPGLSADIQKQFGQAPQIRVIVQPVTQNTDGTLNVHDIAAHLVFSVAQLDPDTPAEPGCLPRFKADPDALRAIVADLAALRTKLANGRLGLAKVSTDGVPLGVHPGLKNPATAAPVRDEMKAFLERHLAAGNLVAMAIQALPAAAASPWIFLSMSNSAPAGFVPVPVPTLDGRQFAQMLNPVVANPRVVPTPHNNNLAPMTCQNAALPTPLPLAGRSGGSTSDLFANPVAVGDKAKSLLDLIADPARSHFFNTDCVSCHTETRLRMDRLHVTSIPGIDNAMLPAGPWTARNFGWSAGPPAQATVAERTATETAAVVQFFNAGLLAGR